MRDEVGGVCRLRAYTNQYARSFHYSSPLTRQMVVQGLQRKESPCVVPPGGCEILSGNTELWGCWSELPAISKSEAQPSTIRSSSNFCHDVASHGTYNPSQWRSKINPTRRAQVETGVNNDAPQFQAAFLLSFVPRVVTASIWLVR